MVITLQSSQLLINELGYKNQRPFVSSMGTESLLRTCAPSLEAWLSLRHMGTTASLWEMGGKAGKK